MGLIVSLVKSMTEIFWAIVIDDQLYSDETAIKNIKSLVVLLEKRLSEIFGFLNGKPRSP